MVLLVVLLVARKPKYVDVLKGSKTTNPSVPAPDLFPPLIPSQPTGNYFVSAPGKWSSFKFCYRDLEMRVLSYLFPIDYFIIILFN
jgi:hypothetical protein